jgi:AraC-like DNA-binding protein
MLKSLLLLTPLLVTLFWTILLNFDTKHHTNPQRILGKIMLLAFLVFFFNILVFIPVKICVPYIEPLLQFTALLLYPMFYIYIRLLTVDDKFSFKAHARFLNIPAFIFLLYVAGILATPFEEYKKWVFDRSNYQSLSPGVQYLNFILLLIRFTIIVQIIAVAAGNFKLIKKYGNKAGQYYSHLEDDDASTVQLSNWVFLSIGIVAVFWASIGRSYFMHDMTAFLPTLISLCVTIVYATMFFAIGWIGQKQKALNPTFEIETEEVTHGNRSINVAQRKILKKILVLFNEEKIYLNMNLTILDVAQSVGTNRTYISSIINQQYDQNFCTFVNSFRVDELEKVIKENPSFSLDVLSESCGFGTVHSLKRAFLAKKQQPFPEWRKENQLVQIG